MLLRNSYQRHSVVLWLTLGFTALPMVASAVTLQDGQAQIGIGDWSGAKQTFTVLAPTNCVAKYYLGYATANLGDAEGTADAELGALRCALPAASHAHALSLLEVVIVSNGQRTARATNDSLVSE